MSHLSHNEDGKPSLSYWEQQLLRPNLKEPPMVSKYHWLKPLTVYHALEFKGNRL
jgi:hypothetical protein